MRSFIGFARCRAMVARFLFTDISQMSRSARADYLSRAILPRAYQGGRGEARRQKPPRPRRAVGANRPDYGPCQDHRALRLAWRFSSSVSLKSFL
jgi:hypothetical protein